MILKDPENVIVIDPDLTLLKEARLGSKLDTIRAGISPPPPLVLKVYVVLRT